MSTTNMTRLTSADVRRHVPALYDAGSHLSKAVRESSLEPDLIELIYLRVSQINGCAYCLHMHASKLDELGVAKAKQMLVATWREAGIFSERECAALEWAEAVTLLAVDHVPDAVYESVSARFSDQELVELTAAVTVINLWNRLGVTFRYPPEL